MTSENFCRLCGLKLPLSYLKTLVDIKNEQLDTLISQYLGLKMNETNEYPHAACNLCCKTVFDFHQFALMVQNVQQKFRQSFALPNTASADAFTNSSIKLENEAQHTTYPLPIESSNNDSKHVKNEEDFVDNFHNFDGFTNDFNTDSHDSDDFILERTESDIKSENFEKIYQDIITNNNQNVSTKSENPTSHCNKNENNKINNTIKRRSLHTQFKCYKCDYIVNAAKDLQDHFKVTHNSKAEYVCTECQALFDNLQEFEMHYHEHSNVKRRKIHTCEFCGKQFNNATNYKAHRNLHLGIKPFECEVCGKTFRLKRHKEVHRITVCSKPKKHDSDSQDGGTTDGDLKLVIDLDDNKSSSKQPEFKSKWKCEKCDEYFHSEHILQKHIKNVHITETPEYNCNECDETFDSNYKYDKHLRSVHGIKKKKKKGSTYKCDKCLKEFNHKTNYDNHLLIHSGIKRFSCEKCGRKFHLKQHLVAHSLTHLDINKADEVKCETCEKMFKNQDVLNRHLRTHIPKSERYIYKCDMCSQRFETIEKKEAHQINKHENEKEKESICDQCGKVFKNIHQLSWHLKTHSDISPYKCDECSKVFRSKSGLKKHKLIHTGEKPFECEVCGKRFRLKQMLTVHSSIHSNELPFECTVCTKKFRKKDFLKVHLRQHTGERPYSCLECNHSFANDSNFIKHLKGKHGLRNFSIQNQHRYPFTNTNNQ